MLSPVLFTMFFAEVVHAILVSSSEDENLIVNLVQLEDDGLGGTNGPLLVHARRKILGTLNADEDGIASKSPESFAKMMVVIVTVFEATGLIVS